MYFLNISYDVRSAQSLFYKNYELTDRKSKTGFCNELSVLQLFLPYPEESVLSAKPKPETFHVHQRGT